jgi:ABC-type ATPase involved in cell division
MPGFLRGTTKDRAPAKRGGAEITISGLGKSFGPANVWSDRSFTVPSGEITALIGPSGTGKSVFVSCVLGLLKPETGSIVIHGTDVAQLGATDMREMRKRFGVLFQSTGLFGSVNLYENVAFPLRERTRMKEREIRPIVMEKLEMVGLAGEEDKLPSELSGGMRKRAGLARALALEPEVIILDEAGPGAYRVPEPAHRRPERSDGLDVPHRHPRHEHRDHTRGQHRRDLPPAAGHVRRPGAGAEQQRPGGGPVHAGQPVRPDRNVGGARRRRPADLR